MNPFRVVVGGDQSYLVAGLLKADSQSQIRLHVAAGAVRGDNYFQSQPFFAESRLTFRASLELPREAR